MSSTSTMMREALEQQRQGAVSEAEAIYRRILASEPAHFDALHMLGVVLHQRGRQEEALDAMRRALLVRDDAAARSNLGIVLRAMGRPAEALEAFLYAIRLDPLFVRAHNNRGNALRDLGRFDDALASYERALEVAPGYLPALRNRADVLHDLGRHEEALVDLDHVLAVDPTDVDAWLARGKILALMDRLPDALACFQSCVRLRPGHIEGLVKLADVLLSLMRPREALACAERALALSPFHTEAGRSRAAALYALDRHDEAIDALAQLTCAESEWSEVRLDLGIMLTTARRSEEAVAVLADLVARAPEQPLAMGQLLHARMLACDWTHFAQLRDDVIAGVREHRLVVEPFAFQAIAEQPSDLLSCAVDFATERLPVVLPGAPCVAPLAGRRMRIGYVSGEFREQATSILLVEVLEKHDRERFEIFGFDNGYDDGSELRGRLLRAIDQHVRIAHLDDVAAAGAVRAAGIDVLVNLNGYFGRHRNGVFARRPAPVQVNYLGFPGTLGNGSVDYIIADRHVIPPGEERYYVEQVVRLPGSYQANDSRRRIAAAAPTRAACGLPADAFVFCCFNNNYKITPAVFGIWMRLLERVRGAVLWLIEDNPAVAGNLRREASERGIDGDRLVFARRVPPADHLARHALADLFLDTLPYNAHTTASDALWAGLPVLTCEGTTFPGRVATSLLRTLGLTELVATSQADYEASALALARDPPRLAAIRKRLGAARVASPLFSGAACCGHLEAAYATMCARSARGEAPEPFDVAS